MTEEERNLDLIIGDLEQENRLLRARNERLEKRDLTDEDIWKFWWDRPEVPNGEDNSMEAEFIAAVRAIIAKMKS